MLAYLRKVGRTTADRGATAVEYGLMIAAIAAVIVALVFGIGTLIRGAFLDTCNDLRAGQIDNGGTGGATRCGGAAPVNG